MLIVFGRRAEKVVYSVVVRSPDRATGLTEGLPQWLYAHQIAHLFFFGAGRVGTTMERYRIHSEAAVYFVTYSIVEWLPVFVSDSACRIITDSLNFCHQHKGLRTNAYVIMPTHMHAILFDKDFDPQRLRASLADFRKFTGRSLSDFCTRHLPPCFASVFREAATADRSRRFWQPGRHPEAIKTETFWRQKLDYLHTNPCRKGLVRMADHWRFSSALYYLSDGRLECDVTINALDWS